MGSAWEDVGHLAVQRFYHPSNWLPWAILEPSQELDTLSDKGKKGRDAWSTAHLEQGDSLPTEFESP